MGEKVVTRCPVCNRRTEDVCDRHDLPVCRNCECVWVVENGRFEHVLRGAATPYLRWYMGKWPKELPPPRTKQIARDAMSVEPIIGHMLETMCSALSPLWDREDALLAIAEVAVRVHARDAIAIDRWNDYVKRENVKRRKRKLKGWKNNYYSRTLKEIDDPEDE